MKMRQLIDVLISRHISRALPPAFDLSKEGAQSGKKMEKGGGGEERAQAGRCQKDR